MPDPTTGQYAARWGYRRFDARRYERRRYGGVVRGANHWMLKRALAKALAPVPVGGIVLDAPCGTGILTPFLLGRGFRVAGVDVAPAMLDVARRRGGTIGLAMMDLEYPALKSKSVDAVVSSRFYMHLPRHARPGMLRSMVDLSRGPVIVTVCHPYTIKSALRAVRRAIGFKVKRQPRLTRLEFEGEVRAAGLKLDRMIGVIPLLSEVWVMVVS